MDLVLGDLIEKHSQKSSHGSAIQLTSEDIGMNSSLNPSDSRRRVVGGVEDEIRCEMVRNQERIPRRIKI